MDPTEMVLLILWKMVRLHRADGEPEEQVIDRRQLIDDLRDLAVHLEGGGSVPIVGRSPHSVLHGFRIGN